MLKVRAVKDMGENNMGRMIKLEWNFKTVRCANLCVYSTFDKQGMSSLRRLASLLFKSGICGCIRIVNDNGELIEDWSKGYRRFSTDIFNEQLRQNEKRDGENNGENNN